MEVRCVNLLAALLNLLDEKVRVRINECLDSRKLDRALQHMIVMRSFPKWFARSFHFDPFYGVLNNLRLNMSYAFANGLLRIDGTHFQYHADLSERAISALLADIPFDTDEAKRLARELSHLLNESLS